MSLKNIGVIGAGTMGNGIAQTCAIRGYNVIMQDVSDEVVQKGLDALGSSLERLVKKDKITQEACTQALARIQASTDIEAMAECDLVVEAASENMDVKIPIFSKLHAICQESAILASNTSSLSLTKLAAASGRPDRVVGVHFFNPVHRMPLVEIIRGEKTSDDTIAAVVAATLQMGKTPIVVNDCPGFLVNRVLFPYFAGFSKLLLDGADFVAVDKVMEKQFGWPMGPAYLLDVVGMDTADHAASVMADGIPERMQKIDNDPVTVLFNAQRLGQKNGKGFYNFGTDKRGRPSKEAAAEAYELITPNAAAKQDFSSEEIIARLMIPMANEAIRCLEEGIVASAAEADMALLYGLGFPPFRGGIFRYIETMGLANFVELADKYAHLGPIYQITDGVRQMAADGKSYFA